MRGNPVLDQPRSRDQVPVPRQQTPLSGAPDAPRHLAGGGGIDRPIWIQRTPPSRRHGFHWLLILPGIAPLLTPLYNRIEPTLWGIPFFYWYQLACAVFAGIVVTFVYLVTKGRRS